MRNVITTVLELLGIGCLVACAAVIWWPAALAVLGIGLIFISRGITLGVPSRGDDE